MTFIPPCEALNIEFKSDQKCISDSVIVEEVVALANTDGGTLYVGIEDDGSITGAQANHRDPVRITALVANRTVPPVTTRVSVLDETVPVLVIEVPLSRSVVATSTGKMLKRRLKADGTPETVPMYPHEITTRLSDLSRLDYSAQAVTDASRDDFSPFERERLREAIRSYDNSDRQLLSLSDEEIERALGLIVRDGDGFVPTLAGMLLLGRPESLERHVPTYSAAFQVLQGTDIKVNVSYRQAILSTIEKMFEAIEPWNPITEVSSGLFSYAVPAFNARAIREALVNAFGHRDYSLLGRVRVQIDEGGLTIASPGGFIEGISIENLLTAEPRGRNPRLMDALKRIGLAERTGRGIDRIYEGSLLYGRPLPDYSASNNTLVSLYIAQSAPDLDFVSMLEEERFKTGRTISLQSLLVLDALKRARRATAGELSEGLDIASTRLKQTLEELAEAGLVEATGYGKNRSFMLGRAVYRRKKRDKEYVRLKDIEKVRHPEMIMQLAQSQGRVTTNDVVELLHTESTSAYYEIKKLVKEGKLIVHRAGPASYYEPTAKKR